MAHTVHEYNHGGVCIFCGYEKPKVILPTNLENKKTPEGVSLSEKFPIPDYFIISRTKPSISKNTARKMLSNRISSEVEQREREARRSATAHELSLLKGSAILTPDGQVDTRTSNIIHEYANKRLQKLALEGDKQ